MSRIDRTVNWGVMIPVALMLLGVFWLAIQNHLA